MGHGVSAHIKTPGISQTECSPEVPARVRSSGEDDHNYRRTINRQLNKGETLHALRRFLFFANEGKIRKAYHEAQATQASCLTLVVNAVITWNTVYMAHVLDQLRQEGLTFSEEDLAHLAPARFEHINPYGKYRFDMGQAFDIGNFRPLRSP